LIPGFGCRPIASSSDAPDPDNRFNALSTAFEMLGKFRTVLWLILGGGLGPGLGAQKRWG
jgi:hypothetical protein